MHDGIQLGLFGPGDLSSDKIGAPTLARLVDSADAMGALLQSLDRAEHIAFDTETTGVDMTRCALVGVSFATEPGQGWYIPVDTPGATWQLRPGSPQWAELADVFARAPGQRYAHNAKFDFGVLKRAGIITDKPVYDTMLAQFAIDPLGRGLGLKALAGARLGWEMIEIADLIGPSRGRGGGRVAQRSMRDVPVELAARYAAADADATLRIALQQQPEIARLNLGRLLHEIEFPLAPVLADMELAGVAVNLPHLAAISDELAGRMRALETQIHALAGRAFNIGSPQQLSDVLYKTLELPVRLRENRRPGDGPSTSAWRLEGLRDKHAIVNLVLEYRELAKLKGTYVDALPALVNPETGRVHTHFNQAVVITGRLSSSNPNLQNVPITSALGRRVRKAFVARPGAQVLSADYSQVELRILAHLADDPALRAVFERGEDAHATTAAAIYGVPLASVSSEQRGYGKRINFGLAYGMSAGGLASGTGMSMADAQGYIDAYFKRFSGVKRWLDNTKRKMLDLGYVDTLYGRRRTFEDMRLAEPAKRRGNERLAINHPVQGSAADIIKLAMVNLRRALRTGGYDALLTLQVHDELVLDVPAAEVREVSAIVKREMEHAVSLSTPLAVDMGVGPNWDEPAG